MPSAPVPAQDEVFLERHWARPLKPQGEFPKTSSYHAMTLDAKSCGTCHVEQYSAWKQSLHSRAMGPGVFGQLVELSPHARADHQSCISCHAPLEEQSASLVRVLQGKKSDLHAQGVTCAGCHLREKIWYGPPRRDGSSVPVEAVSQMPHGSWVSSSAFESSKFCAGCHQFSAGDPELNGKLLENTYDEWRESRFAAEGVSCQKCHMPDRRHIWRGIHDPETVKGGIEISESKPVVSDGVVIASLTVTNRAVGHRFPTYVTPQVFLEIAQVDTVGREIRKTKKTLRIARDVSENLKQEFSDTRLAPDESATLEYREPRHAMAKKLVTRVRVEPDRFYTGFYRRWLKQGRAKRGRDLIREALKSSLDSVYEVHSNRFPLD